MSEEKIEKIDIEKTIGEMVKSFKYAYKIERINEGKPIPYNGQDITLSELLCSDANIKKSFSATHLKWMNESHCREAIEIIFLKLFQLGFQQARAHNEWLQRFNRLSKLYDCLQEDNQQLRKINQLLQKDVD